MLDLGRVVAIHPESHSVDLLMMADGRRLTGVQVVSGSASTNTGSNDLATPDINNAGNPFESTPSGTRDALAVVAYAGHIPLVMGFLFPQVSQLLFPDPDRMVYRHASDVYVTIDKSGNTEIAHPSGTFFKIGATPEHDDLTAKDFDKRWKIARNTGQAVHLSLVVKNGGAEMARFAMDPAGNALLDTVGNVTADVGGNATATVAGNLSATVGGTTTVQSAGVMDLTAPTITLNGNVVLNGPLTQGKGGNGGGCTMLGPLTVTNDVTAGGKSLINHVHSGVMPGGANTGAPV